MKLLAKRHRSTFFKYPTFFVLFTDNIYWWLEKRGNLIWARNIGKEVSVDNASGQTDQPEGEKSFLANVSVGGKLTGLVIFMAFFVALLAGVGYWGINRVGTESENALVRNQQIAALWAFRNWGYVQYAHQADLIINNNSGVIEEYNQAAREKDNLKDQIAKSIDTADEKKWLAEVLDADEKFDALFNNEIVPAWKAKDTKKLTELDQKSDQYLKIIDTNTMKMITNYAQEAQEAEDKALQARNQADLILIIAAAFSIIFGLAAGIILARSISNPLKTITMGARLLSQGDAEVTGIDRNLIIRINRRSDELGKIGRAFTDLIGYFQERSEVAKAIARGDLSTPPTSRGKTDILGNAFVEMYQGLHSAINQVAVTSNQVSESAAMLAGSAAQANQATTQISTTIQQVAKGITQ